MTICLVHVQVAQQGEMTERIDANVEETLGNVDNAKQQLLKYLNNISNNRWLMLKVFFVLLIFLVVFIVFIA
jgi:syntaxin 5